MRNLRWGLSVFLAKWRNRLRYITAARSTYRNWWAMYLVGWLDTPLVLELRNGLRYIVRPGTTDRAVINESFILNPYLKAGYFTFPQDAVIVDVGANIGDFTMMISRLCPNGLIYAIEPIGAHADAVSMHALLNQCTNVKVLHLGLGASEGELEIHESGGQSSVYWGEGKVQRARLTTLASVMAENSIDKIDLLKLDCEGAEWDIIPGAESVLPRIRQLCMEYHNGKLNANWLENWLRDRGYEVRRTPGEWNGLLWAWRVSP